MDGGRAFGYAVFAEQARTDGVVSAALVYAEQAWGIVRALLFLACLVLVPFVALSPLPTLADWLSGNKARMVLRAYFGPPTLLSVTIAVVLVGMYFWALFRAVVLLLTRNMRRRRAVADPVKAALRSHERYWDRALLAALGDPFVSDAFGAHPRSHMRNNIPFDAHAEDCFSTGSGRMKWSACHTRCCTSSMARCMEWNGQLAKATGTALTTSGPILSTWPSLLATLFAAKRGDRSDGNPTSQDLG